MNMFKKISAVTLAGLIMNPNFIRSFAAVAPTVKEQPKSQVVARKIDPKAENKSNSITDNKNKMPLKPAAPSISKLSANNQNKKSSWVPVDFIQIGSLLLTGAGLTQILNTFVLSPRQQADLQKQLQKKQKESTHLQKQLQEEQEKVTKLNQEIENLKNQPGNSSDGAEVKNLEKELEKSKNKIEELKTALKSGDEAQQQLSQVNSDLEQEKQKVRQLEDEKNNLQAQQLAFYVKVQNAMNNPACTRKNILAAIFGYYKQSVPDFYYDLIDVMFAQALSIYGIDNVNLNFRDWNCDWFDPICREISKNKYCNKSGVITIYTSQTLSGSHLIFNHWDGCSLNQWYFNSVTDLYIYIFGSVMRLATVDVKNAPKGFDFVSSVHMLFHLLNAYEKKIFSIPIKAQ